VERLPKQVYTAEFQAEAVRVVLEEGLSLAEAARRISVPKGTLTNWVMKARKGKPVTAATGRAPVSELEAENARLRRELAEARMERDILKKATAYFARLRHEVAYIIVSPAHEVGDETGCSVSRSLPVHASPATASCEATGTKRRTFGLRHLPRGRGVTCQHRGG
jgi:transposase